jgi:hypothetical protein
MKVTAPPWLIVTEAGLKVSELVAFTVEDETPGVVVGTGVGVGAWAWVEVELLQATGIKTKKPQTTKNKNAKTLFIIVLLKRFNASCKKE